MSESFNGTRRARVRRLRRWFPLAMMFGVIQSCGHGDASSLLAPQASLLDAAVVVLTPQAVTLASGGSNQFVATAVLPDSTTVVPDVLWSATGGTISTTGVFTANAAPGTYQVSAQIKGHNRRGTAPVTVAAATLTSMSMSPSFASLAEGATQQFVITGVWSDGTTAVPSVSYSVTGGTMTAGGLYTAGTTPGTFRVIATQQGGTLADTSTVTIAAPAAILLQMVMTPATLALAPGGTGQFSVAGSWSDGTSAAPAVTYTATGGTITAGGLYTAGTTGGPFRVIAKQQSGTKADTSTVTITVPPATLTQMVMNPASLTVAPGGTGQFTVTGTWSDGSSTPPAVTYSVTGGTITSAGQYTAGATAGAFRVIATQQGGSKADTSAVTITAPAAPPPATTLRALAAARNFRIGTDAITSTLAAGGTYSATLAAQFNSVTPDNAMKFAVIHPGSGQYYFPDADQIVSFAQANGMAIHGHTLVWNQSLPSWISSGTFTKAQLLAVLKDHITTVVGRYAGKLATWDVVNEAIIWDGTLRPDPWLSIIGPEYIDSAFVWAKRADPSAKLYYNDYGTEGPGQKTDSLYALVTRLKARGVPIDGVGFQTHAYPMNMPPTGLPSESALSANFARFTNAGFDIRVSELDVMVPDTASAAALTSQAAVYQSVLDACLLNSRCTGLTIWGFTDLYSWIPANFPGFGRGLPFDVNYQPKPALNALLTRLSQP